MALWESIYIYIYTQYDPSSPLCIKVLCLQTWSRLVHTNDNGVCIGFNLNTYGLCITFMIYQLKTSHVYTQSVMYLSITVRTIQYFGITLKSQKSSSRTLHSFKLVSLSPTILFLEKWWCIVKDHDPLKKKLEFHNDSISWKWGLKD